MKSLICLAAVGAAIGVGLSAGASAASPADCKACVGGSIVVGGLIHPGGGSRPGGGNPGSNAENLRCPDLLVVGLGPKNESWSAFASGNIADGKCEFALPAGASPTTLLLKAWPSGKVIESLLLGGTVMLVFHVRKLDLEKYTGKRFAEDRR